MRRYGPRVLAIVAIAAALAGSAAQALEIRYRGTPVTVESVTLSGRATGDGTGLRLQGAAAGPAGNTDFDIVLRRTAAGLAVDGTAEASAGDAAPALPGWLPPWRSVRLAPARDGAPLAMLGNGSVTLDAAISPRPGDTAFTLQGRVETGGDAVRANPLSLTARALPLGPVRLRRFSFDGEAATGGGTVRLEGTAEIEPADLPGGVTLLRPLRFSRLALRLGADGQRAEATLDSPEAEAGGLRVAAAAATADLTRTPDGGLAGTLALTRLRQDAATPWLAPVDVAAQVAGDIETLRLDGSLRPSDTELTVPWRLQIAPASADGRGSLGPATLTFGGAGLDPAALSPALAALAEPEGTVTVEAGMTLADGALETEATVGLDGLTLRTAAAAAEGLRGTVAMASLMPPRTAGVQEVSAERVVAAVPFTDARLRFRLVDGPAIAVETMRAEFAGATLSADDARFDLSTGRGAVTVDLQGLDLARLFDALSLDDFNGSGTMQGSVPVELTAQGLRVGRGSIAATGPGRLTVGFGAARQTLMNQGDYVRLMVQALEDFRYDELEVAVQRPPDGELGLDVTLLGQNPEVLDGHPFRFNISINGDVEPILDALREGRRLTGDLLRNSLEARP